jgi:hypothetical protein
MMSCAAPVRICLLTLGAAIAMGSDAAAQAAAGSSPASASEYHATGTLISAIREALTAPPPKLSTAVANPIPTFRVTIQADEAARFQARLAPLLHFTDDEKRAFRMNARGGVDPLILLHASQRAVRWYETARARREVAEELRQLQALVRAAQAASADQPPKK